MDNMNVAPINHGVVSATGTVAAGTAGGFVKSGLKTMAWFIGIGAVVGALAMTGLLPLGAIFTGSAGAGGAIASTLGFLGNAALGGLLGGTVASLVSIPFGGIGAAFGALKGGSHAYRQVKLEQGAANAMQAQVAVYQAQAIAASNDNKYNFPAQGTQFNQAGSTVNAMQADGRVDGMQLQRA